jgi:hypothetical protein
VYVTLTETPATSIYVNFQTAHQCQPSVVVYDIVSHQNESALTAYKNRTEGDQWKHTTADFSRGIHYVLLQNLQPDTGNDFSVFHHVHAPPRLSNIVFISVYYFRAGCGDNIKTFSEEKRLLTLPAHGDVTFVAGGDMGTTEAAQKVRARWSDTSGTCLYIPLCRSTRLLRQNLHTSLWSAVT